MARILKSIPALLLLAVLLFSCGEIQQQSSVETSSTSVAGQLVAGIGDAVLSIQNSESLPNAFGGADIFGRTRPTGTTTLYFVGVRGDKARFIRRDVLIQSSKTTMNTTPIVINPSSQTVYSGYVAGIPYSGYANTTAHPIIVPPNTPGDRVVGVRDLEIEIPIGQSLLVSGQTVVVTAANTNQVSYVLK